MSRRAELFPGEFAKSGRSWRSSYRSPMRPSREARTATSLHEVRKRTKRLRYAAETAIPVREKPARELANAARDLQATLGTLQDSIVARDLLLRLAVSAQLRGESGFSYGRLHALEQSRAAASEQAFHRAWKNFDTPSIID